MHVMFLSFLLMSINKSNFCAGFVNVENVESFIFTNSFFNLVRFEPFACTSLLDFGNFESAPATNGDHLTDDIINSVNDTFGFSRTIFNAKGQGVFGHLHKPHGFINILFFNCVLSPKSGKSCG